MTTNLIEAAERELSTLEAIEDGRAYQHPIRVTIADLTAAIEAAKKVEPVAEVCCRYKQSDYHQIKTDDLTILPIKGMAESGLKEGDKLYLTPPAQPVPAGYKLVPIEPTNEMIQAAKSAAQRGGDYIGEIYWKHWYALMLDAAPEAQT